MELQLWALTQRIRADAAGSEALRGSLAAELARRFGAGALPPASCRAASPVPVPLRAIARSAEIDVGIPRWSEDPTHIIGVLTTLFDKPNPLFAGPVFAPISGQLPAARHDGAGPGAGRRWMRQSGSRPEPPVGDSRSVQRLLGRAEAK